MNFLVQSHPPLTKKLLHAKMRDGRPAFNFMDLRRFSATLRRFEDNRNILYLLQNAKLLEKLQLSVVRGQSLVGLLSASAPTLKVLDLSVSFLWDGILRTCEEPEALAGHNMLVDFKVRVVVGVDHTILQSVSDSYSKSGGCTGQTWVVCAKTGFL